MLSAIIATYESERALVPTLAALVPGAAAGLLAEVIVADAASSDATSEVAEFAGCRFMSSTEPLGARLKSAATGARPLADVPASWRGSAARVDRSRRPIHAGNRFNRRRGASRGVSTSRSRRLFETKFGGGRRPAAGGPLGKPEAGPGSVDRSPLLRGHRRPFRSRRR